MQSEMRALPLIQLRAKRSENQPSKQLYRALLEPRLSPQTRADARQYLLGCLHQARLLDSDLPADMQELPKWIDRSVEKVGKRYKHYLAERQAGMPRWYFSGIAHALHFLRGVAPTKLVDGAWLYGLTRHWNDPRFQPLIRIYLEELGDGAPDKNHVLIYKQLLATHGCEDWDKLSDDHYVQGAIQLALANDPEHFLPELIGFNLGYEQLPLHLLISAYELKELGIDPYYFTLHITIDNAVSGHARQALQALQEAMPRIGDRQAFYQRVIDGYRLNMLGESTSSVIASFDAHEEVIALFREKATVGQLMHSDFCSVAGKTINEWLSSEEQIPGFIQALEQNRWIQRNQPAENSRFWQLLQGPRAKMFGVFSPYEMQLIHDWIVGDSASTPRSVLAKPARPVFAQVDHAGNVRRATDQMVEEPPVEAKASFDEDLALLKQRVALPGNREGLMQTLARLMAPNSHFTPAGLLATRVYSRMLHQH